jgi:hypothetical protein
MAIRPAPGLHLQRLVLKPHECQGSNDIRRFQRNQGKTPTRLTHASQVQFGLARVAQCTALYPAGVQFAKALLTRHRQMLDESPLIVRLRGLPGFVDKSFVIGRSVAPYAIFLKSI